MLDIIAAIFATAYCAAQTGLLIGSAPLRGATKIGAFAAAAAWLASVVAVYGLRVLSPGALGPVPVNLVPFIWWQFMPAASQACSSCFFISTDDCRRRSRRSPPSET